MRDPPPGGSQGDAATEGIQGELIEIQPNRVNTSTSENDLPPSCRVRYTTTNCACLETMHTNDTADSTGRNMGLGSGASVPKMEEEVNLKCQQGFIVEVSPTFHGDNGAIRTACCSVECLLATTFAFHQQLRH